MTYLFIRGNVFLVIVLIGDEGVLFEKNTGFNRASMAEVNKLIKLHVLARCFSVC
jgi:hypothetical protein